GRFGRETGAVSLALRSRRWERGIPEIDRQRAIALGKGAVGRIEGQYLLLVPLNESERAYADGQLPKTCKLRRINSELAGRSADRPRRARAQPPHCDVVLRQLCSAQ